MAITKTTAIDASRIKTRWEEPYVSSAINKEMAAIPRGVYRGFQVTQKAVPAAGISIKVKSGEDSVLVHRGYTSGHSTLLRYDDDFDIDFSFDASSGPVTLYVWCDVNYTIGTTTTGSILVGASGDRSADSITIAKIVIPMSATTILDAYITQDWTDSDTMTNPDPTEADWGFINETIYDRIPTSDEKDGLSNASPAASASNPYVTESATVDKVFAKPVAVTKSGLAGTETKFQLTGDFYIGKGAQGTAQKWFGLHEISGGNPLPDEYAGDDKDKVYITAIYKNDDSVEVTPSSDADTNGFYSNPYIYLSAAIGLTSIAVRCGQEEDYAGLPVTALVAETDGIRTGASNDVSFLAAANQDRRPVTYTVAADSTTKANYNGTTALIDALDALQASSATSGIIFVKQGTYYWDGTGGNRTYTKKIKIIGEAASHDSTANCHFQLQHTSGYGITFSAAVEIEGMLFEASASTELVQFSNQFYIRNSRFMNGAAYFYGRASLTLPDGGIVENCWFDTNQSEVAAKITRTYSGATFKNCYFLSAGQYAFSFESGSCQYIMFDGCEFDGTNNSTVDGPALYFASGCQLYASAFRSCAFICRGSYAAIIFTAGCHIVSTEFREIRIFHGAAYSALSTTGLIDIPIDDSYEQQILFDGVRFEFNYTTAIIHPLINVVTASSGGGCIGASVEFRNVFILGNANPIQGNNSSIYDSGLIRFIGQNLNDEGVRFVLDGLEVVNLRAATIASTYAGYLIQTGMYASGGSVHINNVCIRKVNTTAAGTYSRFTVIGADGVSSGFGALYISNCYINLEDLATGTTNVHKGFYLQNAFEFFHISHNHFQQVRNGEIQQWSTDDDIQMVINGNTSVLSISSAGLTGVGNSRIYTTAGKNAICGNTFEERADSNLEYYIYINTSGADASSVVGNCAFMANAGTKYFLYATDPSQWISMMGNSGLGDISYKSGTAFTGDATTNSISGTWTAR